MNVIREATDLCNYEEIFESEMSGLFYFAVGINIVLSVAIVVVQLIILFSVHNTLDSYLDECGRAFNNAMNVTEFIRLPIAGILVMAEVAGISFEEVIHEYEKESFERRALIFGLFGHNNVANRFVDWPDGKFIKHGYEGQEALLNKVKKKD